LRMLLEVLGRRDDALNYPSLQVALRGDMFRFHNVKAQTTDIVCQTGASMQWTANASIQENVSCTWSGSVVSKCQPADKCKATGSLGSRKCVPRLLPSGSWWKTDIAQLVEVVAPLRTSGRGLKLEQFYGLNMSLYCAPKNNFTSDGALPTTSESLLHCLKKGIETNAELKAKEPWKLYFPDEVVVVASFEEITERFCSLAANSEDVAKALCVPSKNQSSESEFSHLRPKDGIPSGPGTYMGVASGAGWPANTLTEVILSPQDVLEALKLIVPGSGR